MTHDPNYKAYLDGAEAAKKGFNRDSCDLPLGDERRAWTEGFDEASRSESVSLSKKVAKLEKQCEQFRGLLSEVISTLHVNAECGGIQLQNPEAHQLFCDFLHGWKRRYEMLLEEK